MNRERKKEKRKKIQIKKRENKDNSLINKMDENPK